LVRNHEPVLALPTARILRVVERNSFRFFPADRIARSNENEKRNEFRSTKKKLRRRNYGGARQLVRNHGQTWAGAPSENGRLPPVLTHQLASAYKFPPVFGGFAHERVDQPKWIPSSSRTDPVGLVP
jgi:hypothetical protein